MTDKPEIKVGQRWRTRDCGDVLIVSTTASGNMPIVAEWGRDFYRVFPDGRAHSVHEDDRDLISLAPSTVKREVALYRVDGEILIYDAKPGERLPADALNDYRISEPLTIEFTLLPGESAE